MIIAGITGGIGHGKTTFANLLATNSKSAAHFESWQLVAEVGNALRQENGFHPNSDDLDRINEWLYALPEIVSWHMHTDVAFDSIRVTAERVKSHPEHYAKLKEYLDTMQRDDALQTADITEENKDQYRPLLQWLGGYLVARIGPGIWYDEIVRRIAHLRGSGYDLVTVGGVRYPGDAERLRNAGGSIIEIKRPTAPTRDGHDITERERSDINADCIIMNDGSLDELGSCAREIYEDLRMRQLHADYTAHPAAA